MSDEENSRKRESPEDEYLCAWRISIERDELKRKGEITGPTTFNKQSECYKCSGSEEEARRRECDAYNKLKKSDYGL